MSIKIHHGPNGSYKTAGAIHDDALQFIRDGRTIVTNVRGFTREAIFEALPDTPQSLEVINLDMDSKEGLHKIHTWFHWVPIGCAIIFDEHQLLFRKSWRDSDIKALDYPGGLEAAARDNRPVDYYDAIERHRHWNWDFVLTTPNYSRLRDEWKAPADFAYKHKNLGLLSGFFKGTYLQSAHAPEDSGENASDIQMQEKRKIPDDDVTWKIYKSTSTGQHTFSKAGINIFKSPRLLFFGFVFFGCLLYLFRNGTFSVLPQSVKASDLAVNSTSAQVGSSPARSASVDVVSGGVVQPISAPPVFVGSSSTPVVEVPEKQYIAGCYATKLKCICRYVSGLVVKQSQADCMVAFDEGFESRPVTLAFNEVESYDESVVHEDVVLESPPSDIITSGLESFSHSINEPLKKGSMSFPLQSNK